MDRGLSGSPPRLPEGGSAADYVFLLRPVILIPVWTFFLLGARHSGFAGSLYGAGAAPVVGGLAAMTAVFGAAYIVNQITDREADRRSGKLFLLSHGIVPAAAAWAEAAVLAAGALALSYAFLPRDLMPFLAANLVLGAAYSIEPVRLKRRPVLDILANAAAIGLLSALGGWAAAGAEISGIGVLAPYPVAVAAVHLSTALADVEGDRASGLMTSGVLAGRRAGMAVSAVLMAGSAAAALYVGNATALAAALFSLPAFAWSLHAIFRGRDTDVLLPAKASTAVYLVAAGAHFPVFIPAVAAVLVLTRVYYARRFGIRYPSVNSR